MLFVGRFEAVGLYCKLPGTEGQVASPTCHPVTVGLSRDSHVRSAVALTKLTAARRGDGLLEEHKISRWNQLLQLLNDAVK